jgi:hypothetical protein
VESVDAAPLVEAIYWLESAYIIEQVNATQLRAVYQQNASIDSTTAIAGGGFDAHRLVTNTLSEVDDVKGSGAVHTPAHLLKNAGLAHVHLVRNTLLTEYMPLPSEDTLQTLSTGLLSWPSAAEK